MYIVDPHMHTQVSKECCRGNYPRNIYQAQTDRSNKARKVASRSTRPSWTPPPPPTTPPPHRLPGFCSVQGGPTESEPEVAGWKIAPCVRSTLTKTRRGQLPKRTVVDARTVFTPNWRVGRSAGVSQKKAACLNGGITSAIQCPSSAGCKLQYNGLDASVYRARPGLLRARISAVGRVLNLIRRRLYIEALLQEVQALTRRAINRLIVCDE